jgi:hypothetical protein
LQAAAVRAAPVDPAAGRAAGKHLVRAASTRPQLVLDVGLAGRFEYAVTGRAPSPRRQRRSEPAEHVPELLIRDRAAHVRAQPQLPAAQQPAVLGQQDPAAGVRPVDQCVVVQVVPVRGVDADQSHPASQRPQMHVEDEPGGRQ